MNHKIHFKSGFPSGRIPRFSERLLRVEVLAKMLGGTSRIRLPLLCPTLQEGSTAILARLEPSDLITSSQLRFLPPDVGPFILQKSLQVIWRSFEYYAPLKKVLQHVAENPGQALSLAQAARIASLEYTHFATYLRRKTGVTFEYWIDFVRIFRAVQMLDSGDKSVTEIAQDSGFVDGTTFCRTFRRVTGMTPLQYRTGRRPHEPQFQEHVVAQGDYCHHVFGPKPGSNRGQAWKRIDD